MLKFLSVIDEHTRECLAICVDRSIDADDVVATLDKIAGTRGFPVYVRFDNGPEFVAHASITFAVVASSPRGRPRRGKQPSAAP